MLPPAERTVWFRSEWLAVTLVLSCAVQRGGSPNALPAVREMDSPTVSAGRGRSLAESGSTQGMNERACAPGCSETCTDGHCVNTLAAGQKYPNNIAVDSTSVYWTTDPDEYGAVGTVMAAPLDGGPSRTLASGQRHPCDLAVDSTNVYWTNESSFWPGIESRRDDGSVMKAPLAGGAPTVLASGQTGACGIGVVGADVYWVTQGALMKVAVNGGDATRVASARDGASVVALDPQGAWLFGHGALFRDQSVTSVRAIRFSSEVALGASDIYWRDRNAHVMRTPLKGGQSATLSRLSEKLPHVGFRLVFASRIAVDSTNVYLISEEERVRSVPGNFYLEYGFSVATVPTTGGHPTMLAWYFGESPGETTRGASPSMRRASTTPTPAPGRS